MDYPGEKLVVRLWETIEKGGVGLLARIIPDDLDSSTSGVERWRAPGCDGTR